MMPNRYPGSLQLLLQQLMALRHLPLLRQLLPQPQPLLLQSLVRHHLPMLPMLPLLLQLLALHQLLLQAL